MFKGLQYWILGLATAGMAIQWYLYFVREETVFFGNWETLGYRWITLLIGAGSLIWFAVIAQTNKERTYFIVLAIAYAITSTIGAWGLHAVAEDRLAILSAVIHTVLVGVLLLLEALKVSPGPRTSET